MAIHQQYVYLYKCVFVLLYNEIFFWKHNPIFQYLNILHMYYQNQKNIDVDVTFVSQIMKLHLPEVKRSTGFCWFKKDSSWMSMRPLPFCT